MRRIRCVIVIVQAGARQYCTVSGAPGRPDEIRCRPVALGSKQGPALRPAARTEEVGQGEEQRVLVQEFVCAVRSHIQLGARRLKPVEGEAGLVTGKAKLQLHAWVPHGRVTPLGQLSIRCGV